MQNELWAYIDGVGKAFTPILTPCKDLFFFVRSVHASSQNALTPSLMTIAEAKRHHVCECDNEARVTFASKNSEILNEHFGGKHVPEWPVDQLHQEYSTGGALDMRHCIKLGILVLLMLRLCMAALAARLVCVAATSQYEGVVIYRDI